MYEKKECETRVKFRVEFYEWRDKTETRQITKYVLADKVENLGYIDTLVD